MISVVLIQQRSSWLIPHAPETSPTENKSSLMFDTALVITICLPCPQSVFVRKRQIICMVLMALLMLNQISLQCFIKGEILSHCL